MNKKSKTPVIIFIVIVVIALIVYFYYSGKPNDSSTTSLVSNDPNYADTIKRSAEILSLLNQVNSIKIDPRIFQGNVFKSLVDHTVIVPPQNVGKANPFAPFGGFVATPAGTKKTSGSH